MKLFVVIKDKISYNDVTHTNTECVEEATQEGLDCSS